MRNRLSILLLAVFMLSLMACGEKVDRNLPPMDGFIIQPGLVMISHPTEDSVVMEVADGTTLSGFNTCVQATDGHRIALLDEAGNPVTDENAALANGMQFAVYEQDSQTAELTIPIQMADPIQIRRHFSQAAQ